jgi:methionine-rich copper-binding protein CopC/putative copper export protein
MRRFNTISISVVALLMPAIASAHALPVGLSPESSSVLSHSPQTVSINFSEHVDPSASSLSVIGPDGSSVSGKAAVSTDRFALSVPLRDDGNGAYFVVWSTTSADDGHFTKGAYSFVVGQSTSSAPLPPARLSVVEVSNVSEAESSAIELAGNGIIWGILLIFILCIRPLAWRHASKKGRLRFGNVYSRLLVFGFLLAIVGEALQILTKSSQLATLNSTPLSLAAAFPQYLATAAGSETLYRGVAVLVCATVFFYGRKKILDSVRLTFYEVVMLAAMAIFAYYRAITSHVILESRLPFFVTATLNTVHLVTTDLWFGLPFAILVLFNLEDTRALLRDTMSRVFTLLSLCLASLCLTGGFITWALLKSFSNLLHTDWGSGFLEFLFVCLMMVCIHTLAVISRRLLMITT